MSVEKKQKTSDNSELKPFPHPFVVGEIFDGNSLPPKTLVELSMMQLSGTIRSKDRWYDKINDRNIRQKWKDEALADGRLSDKQIDYVLDELNYYDQIRDGTIQMSSVDGVWQSDELISNDLKQSLIELVSHLENVSEKDWHPGTNEQVLDLVHPSLFPYVNLTTKIVQNQIIHRDNALDFLEQGQTIDLYSDQQSNDYSKSKIYQWLPAEFNISNDGQVKIESYINNLHPIEHRQLYSIIEQIFSCFIPLFNKVLTDLIDVRQKSNRIQVDPYHWYDQDESFDGDDEDNRTIHIPDVQQFQMPIVDSSKTMIDLRGRKLQVIVKLANIILTPEKPEYPGGVWHIEGMENEHIVATGIYYYHSSNLTDSNLQFRTSVEEPNYEQNDDRGVRIVYGLRNEESLNQNLGEILTKENRSIAFPNLYQHRVAPFQLKNRTEIGQRKILVFFLVDPSIRILSTDHVPPQQSHWLTNILRSISCFQQLPSLVLDKILNYIDFPMTIEQAKHHREKLMLERKFFISQNNELFFERPFSLCEH